MGFNKTYGGRALRIAFGITIQALLLAGGAGAATITVDDSGGADYMKIQGAVNNAITSNTIVSPILLDVPIYKQSSPSFGTMT